MTNITIITLNFNGFEYPARKLFMPRGMWFVSNETTMRRSDLPVEVDNKINYYFPDTLFLNGSDQELKAELGDCT